MMRYLARRVEPVLQTPKLTAELVVGFAIGIADPCASACMIALGVRAIIIVLWRDNSFHLRPFG
jgi:hypothetical protein